MRHTITAHFYDDRESDRHVLDRINSIHERTHQSYGRILTEMLTSQAGFSASLSEKDILRIAEKSAEIVAEKMKQVLPAHISEYAAGIPAPGQIVDRKNDLPVSSSGLSISEAADIDFSDSAIDFGFIGV
ncbi:MAG: hypothetical protein IIY45_03960 [Firmicutes bacterium]|nr:hypothetical protein [Bacillota bacterium]